MDFKPSSNFFLRTPFLHTSFIRYCIRLIGINYFFCSIFSILVISLFFIIIQENRNYSLLDRFHLYME